MRNGASGAKRCGRRPWALTGTGGGEHGQRGLLLAVLLVPAHELLLTLQDAEVRGYCCIEDIVHPCRKEGALSFSSPIGGPRRVCRLHSTLSSVPPSYLVCTTDCISPGPCLTFFLKQQTGSFFIRKYVCFLPGFLLFSLRLH